MPTREDCRCFDLRAANCIVCQDPIENHCYDSKTITPQPVPLPSSSDLLAPCPCGGQVKSLHITDAGQGGKFAFVSGDCCDEWMIEFRTNYAALDSDACKKLAWAAWNNAPRKATKGL